MEIILSFGKLTARFRSAQVSTRWNVSGDIVPSIEYHRMCSIFEYDGNSIYTLNTMQYRM